MHKKTMAHTIKNNETIPVMMGLCYSDMVKFSELWDNANQIQRDMVISLSCEGHTQKVYNPSKKGKSQDIEIRGLVGGRGSIPSKYEEYSHSLPKSTDRVIRPLI